jgi:predicted nucleotidyltransferase
MLPLNYSQEKLAELCKQYHVQRLSLFGSRLKGTAKPDSDIDILVEFEPDHRLGFGYFRLEEELSKLFHTKVDLNTPGFLSQYFREEVLSTAKPLYVAN